MGVRKAGAMVEAQQREKLKIVLVSDTGRRDYYTVCTATSIGKLHEMYKATIGWGGSIHLFYAGHVLVVEETVERLAGNYGGPNKDGVYEIRAFQCMCGC